MFKLLKQKKNAILGFGGILFALTLWHLVSALKVINPIFLSSPGEVIWELFNFFKSGSIFQDLIASAYEFIIGFTLAFAFGICSGFIIGWFKTVKAVSSPLIFALYTTPTIAIIPLIILWFGFGLWAKVIIVFLASFFPILINVVEAVKNTDPNLIKLAKSFVASDLKILKTIVIPSSLPYVISGIRIAVPRGIIGMVVAEFYTGNIGIGYLISYYGATFQTARLLATVLLIIIVSITISIFIDLLERKVQIWKL